MNIVVDLLASVLAGLFVAALLDYHGYPWTFGTFGGPLTALILVIIFEKLEKLK